MVWLPAAVVVEATNRLLLPQPLLQLQALRLQPVVLNFAVLKIWEQTINKQAVTLQIRTPIYQAQLRELLSLLIKKPKIIQ
ncbi:hypothetical protein BWD08_00465 [Neisseria animaloris]|nr:hypothetical protein BWD08_00465 [Neisseria animaloris]